ncbi:WD40 repeat domain-containing protein [Streptomyces sp. NBC_01089]|uniref:WD40 repeat domain-containing protein n=1 Tax=Streptomyces sp. NBC_01089 TaxID=2903747 RepID=UPI00386C3510|nr:WD40 repeat domain-containing protein [Streptomyces sp. NBC_01089]
MNELLGERQLWWKCCSEAVHTDPAWLFGSDSQELAAWIDVTAPDRPADSVTPTDHAYLLGRALSAPDGRAGEYDEAISRLMEAWGRSGLLSADTAPGPAQPSGRGISGLSPQAASGLSAVIERIAHLQAAGEGRQSTGSRSMVLIAALLMAGAELPKRPLARVPVVFGRSARETGQVTLEQGATGVLELREFPAGPAGLYPDPRAMAGVHSPNGQFAASLGHAWNMAGDRRAGRCVLWRIVLSNDPLPPGRIEGPSLGAAFALGLRELLRYPRSRRPSVAGTRGFFYGLRPRTAVTGALDGSELLLKVSDMDAKLLAARRKGLRLVAPKANQLAVANAPEPGDVRFAETLRQADRYARRFRTGRLITALSLVVAATVPGLVVQHQGAVARDQLATSHRLADVSQSLLQSDPGLAELFAVQAYRHHSDSLTRQALFRAVTASPHLAADVQASGPVSALSASADGRIAFAGTKDGELEQWPLTGTVIGKGQRLGKLPGSVSAVAADGGGGTVAAIDHSTIRVWAAGQQVAAPLIPAGQQPTAVAVSPSGRFVAVSTQTETSGVPPVVRVLDRTTGNTESLDLKGMSGGPTAMAFRSDSQVVAFADDYGIWERISLPGLTRAAGSNVGFGVHNSASALAPDGSYFTYSNTASPLPIWPSDGTPHIDKPSLLATTQTGHPEALALSPGGSWAAAAVGNSLYVSRTVTSGRTPFTPIALPGAGKVSPGTLAFLGKGGSRLISASGDVVSLWDLAQYSRIATQADAAIPVSCNGCRGPSVALSANGLSAAVIDGNNVTADVQKLHPPSAGHQLAQNPPHYGFGAALWKKDGSGIIVVSADGSAQILDPRHGLRVTGTWPRMPDPLHLTDAPAVLQLLPDGGQVAELDSSGTIRFRDTATGKVLRQVDGPRKMAPTSNGSWPLPQGWAAMDTQAAHAAVLDQQAAAISGTRPTVVVTDTATGHSRSIHEADVAGVAYAGQHLLVQRKAGDLEIWTASGSRRLNTIEGTPDTAVGPVVGTDTVAEKPSDNTVQLLDLPSGNRLGPLTLPPGDKAMSTGLAFSADGTILVTATEGDSGNTATIGMGQLISWRLEPDAWIRTACASAGRDLTPSVWSQYMGSDTPSNLHCPT